MKGNQASKPQKLKSNNTPKNEQKYLLSEKLKRRFFGNFLNIM